MRKKYTIGTNAFNGREVQLSMASLNCHTALIGGTGRGKSKMLESLARWHMKQGHGIMVLDPHGTLYDDLLRFVKAAGYRSKLGVIDANNDKEAPGLNFLAPCGLDISAHASQTMRSISKATGDEAGEVKPRLERWQRNLLMTLIDAKLTLSDMLDFLTPGNTLYRESVLKFVTNPHVRQEWESFNRIGKQFDKETLVEAPLNRACKLILSDPVRRIVGQNSSTINICDFVERGGILLVNLAPLRVSRESQQIIGILLIDQLINYAFRRNRSGGMRPFFAFVDEAAELSSPDLQYSLQALRKFKIFFLLAFQNLEQARRVPGYFESIMTNCDIKVAFKTSRHDAEELIGELFPEGLTKREIKDEIMRTVLIPEESERKVTTRSTSTGYSTGITDSSGDSFGTSSGRGISSGFSTGFSRQTVPGSGLFAADSVRAHVETDVMSDTQSEMSSHSHGSFSGTASSKSKSTSASESTSTVPFYEYLERSEVGGRTFYSVEELKERYISWLLLQPARHAQVKIGDNRAVPIVTALVKDIPLREKDIDKLIDYSNTKYALPARVVDKMISERRQRLLELARQKTNQEDSQSIDSRWQ